MRKITGAALSATDKLFAMPPPFWTITASSGLLYVVAMNWINIGIVLNFALVAVAVALLGYAVFR